MANGKGQDDDRVTAPQEPAMLGRLAESVTVAGGPVTAAEIAINPWVIIRPGDAGRDLPFAITARDFKDPSVITLTFESLFLSREAPAIGDTAVFQGVFQFGTGTGQQGFTPNSLAVVGGNNVPLDGRVVVDLEHGSQICFPSSFMRFETQFQIYLDDGWVEGDDPTFEYELSFSIGDYPKQHIQPPTCTILCRNLSGEGGGAVTFISRPKFAKHLFLTCSDDTKASVSLTFLSPVGGAIRVVTAYPLNVNPTPILEWPADCSVLQINNGGATPSFLRVVNHLAL